MMDELLSFSTQQSFLNKDSRAPSFVAKAQVCSEKVGSEEKRHKLNKQCILLLQNLITEQLKNKFDEKIKYNQLNASNITQFKFFLNALEILCHYLNIIDMNNYLYRVKNYGKYEVYFNDLPRKAEKGSIILLQTYNSTIQKDIARLLGLNFGNACTNEPELILAYNDYSFRACQYHAKLRNVFKELQLLHQIILKFQAESGNNAIKDDSIYYLEGIWHPVAKVFYKSNLKKVLEEFELSIRVFEKALIQLVVVFVDLASNKRSSPFANTHLKMKNNCFSPNNPFSEMPSLIKAKEEPSVRSSCQSLTKLLSNVFQAKEGNIPSNNRLRLVLNDLSTDINCNQSVDMFSTPTERQMTKREQIEQKEKALTAIKRTSNYTPTGIYSHFDESPEPMEFFNGTTLVESQKKSQRESDIGSEEPKEINPDKRLREKRFMKYYINSHRFRSSQNKENNFSEEICSKRISEDQNDDLKPQDFWEARLGEPKMNQFNQEKIELKTLFEENRFYKGKINDSFQLLKFR